MQYILKIQKEIIKHHYLLSLKLIVLDFGNFYLIYVGPEQGCESDGSDTFFLGNLKLCLMNCFLQKHRFENEAKNN